MILFEDLSIITILDVFLSSIYVAKYLPLGDILTGLNSLSLKKSSTETSAFTEKVRETIKKEISTLLIYFIVFSLFGEVYNFI